MIPLSMVNQRKGVIGLFFWLGMAFFILILLAVSKNEWDTVAALSGGLIAIVPAVLAYDTIYNSRIEKLPQLDIIIDPTSRYQLFRLGIVNNGGSAAYNISLSWLEVDPKTGRSLPVPFNMFDQPISFCKDERFNFIRMLSKGQTHLTVVDVYHRLYERYPEEAFFLAKLKYSESLIMDSEMEVILPVSFDEFRTTLNYSHEVSKTNYKLQQLPEKFDKIKEALDNISRKLDNPSRS